MDAYSQQAILAVLLFWTTALAQNDPTNVACTVLSSTSIQFTWTQPTNTAVNGYHLSIERTDGINGPTIPSVVLSSYTYVSYTYSGLGNYAQYNLTIHSYIGSTNYSDVSASCQTSEDAPSGAPLNFNCTAISTSEITCVWDALEQAYWNGVLIGYRIQWLGSNTSALYSANVSETVYTYAATGLSYDTRYVFLLSPFTSVNYGSVYSTDVETTLGATTTPVENVTRYYCYEAVPGFIEFSWDEMPCTIYSGAIGGLMLLSLLLLTIMCCQACCQKSKPGVEINMIGGSTRGNTRSSSRRSGVDDDTGSTTETDDEGGDSEHDVSDNEAREGAGSVKPESEMDTPISEMHADLELSDSDYNSDTDDDQGTPPTTNQKRNMKLKPLSKNNVFTANAVVEQNAKTNNLPETSGGVTRQLKQGDDESESIYEDWDPDASNKTADAKTTNERMSSHPDIKAGKSTLNVKHGKPSKQTRTTGNIESSPTNSSNWDDDGLIERTASVSSILVDAQGDGFDSVWSPDITERNGFDKSPETSRQNDLFRAGSSSKMNEKILDKDGKEPLSIESKVVFSVDGVYDEKNNIFLNTVTYDTESTLDIIDNINLNDDPYLRGKGKHRTPTTNASSDEMINGKAPAWLSKRQRDKLRTANNTTPIQDVKLKHNSAIIDIEPILGSDRLGKKFPFLSIDNEQMTRTKVAMTSPTRAWGQPLTRSTKDQRMSKAKSKQATTVIDTAITIVKDNDLKDEDPSVKDVEPNITMVKDKGQIFYGFGIGRFRKVAANWINKMRTKGHNVKLANSKWD